MFSQESRWNKLPKAIRGSVLVGLGASAVLLVQSIPDHHDSASNVESAPNFLVGVTCATDSASVHTSKDNHTYRFQCRDTNGDMVDVDQIMNLRTDLQSTPPGYTAMVRLDAAGNAIEFDFNGAEGVATITYKEPGAYNDPTIGVARVSSS